MARLPKDATEAVDALGITDKSTVALIGPDHGFIEAATAAVGKTGKVIVQSPPPDEPTDGAEIVDAVPSETKADAIVAWVGVVGIHHARDLAVNVADGGSLWLVLPKADRDSRAPVTEGEIKRTMLSAGWREERVVPFSTDAFAVRFRRRR
jgi:hypothetical protein